MAEPSGDERLQSKYKDWCSAILAEHFLQLTPEQIYTLAEEAPTGGDEPGWASRAGAGPPERARPDDPATPSPLPKSSVAASSSYRLLIERVTEVLAHRLHLPTFEEWAAAYAEDPERFERDLWDREDAEPQL
jgi:hypothetical protein